MLAGSFSSTHHGEPRSTRDIDLVVDPSAEALAIAADRWRHAGLYVSPSALTSLDQRGQCNVIDTTTGWKVDLIFCRDRPFSRIELSRRQRATVLGVAVWIASPEDVVLSKLEWASMGASSRQVEDAAGVLAHAADLDQDYLQRWAVELGVVELLAEARRRGDLLRGS